MNLKNELTTGIAVGSRMFFAVGLPAILIVSLATVGCKGKRYGMGTVVNGEGDGSVVGDGQVNHLKVGIKLAVLVVIAVLVFTNRRKEALPDGQFWAILGLTLANTAVAVLV